MSKATQFATAIALLEEAFAIDETAFFDIEDDAENDAPLDVFCAYCGTFGYADPTDINACCHAPSCVVFRVRAFLAEAARG